MNGDDTDEPEDPIADAIDAAEDICDPLEGLVEKSETDPGAAFMPEVLERLAALKKEDRAAFEALRSKLKKAGCRVTALDEAIAEENGTGGRGPTQADILIDLAQTAELFHAPDGTGFADLDINGHRETWPIRAKGFRRWLARRFFEATDGAPSSEALQSALNVIEAKAHFDAPERVVHVRVGGLDGKLYLDLGDETWRAVEIDATGWRVIDNPPVRFRRAAGMQRLPMPVAGGSVETLRSFLNVQSDADFVLVVAWALACLRNRGPYPVIVLSGEQGSAKSTFSAILRALLDPNTAPLRALPREDRDLFIAASNGHVLAFDNVSGLPAWISDTLCRLAPGGGFAVRQLYTDQDEVLFDATRPVILNGIEDIVTRPDLADRAVFLTLEPIPEERRRPEAELWAAFEAERPRILGVLLNAVVEGLKRLPDTHLPKLPRMADFALWVTACETALWPAGTFWSAYCGNRDEAVEGVIDADPVAAAVRVMMATRTVWTGNASDLLGALGEVVGERAAKSKTWPDNPRALSGRLRRAATFLRKTGIEIVFKKEGRTRTRIIYITTTPSPAAAEKRDGSTWFLEAKKRWDKKKTDKNREMKTTLPAYLDWQTKLSEQNPDAKFLVLYTSSATDASAVVVDRRQFDHPFIVDHKTYWCECTSESEAHFVAAYVNSNYANDKIKEFQSRGLFGPRDIHKLIVKLPFPKFQKGEAKHEALAELGRKCATLANNFVRISNVEDLQARALGVIRARIKDQLEAELAEIDALVSELSGGTSGYERKPRKKSRGSRAIKMLFD